MFRALLELGFTILIIIIARMILTSVMKGFVNAGRQAQGGDPSPGKPRQSDHPTGELYKDPVCGTFVTESTPFRRQISGRNYYYCSADCREKHALVAK